MADNLPRGIRNNNPCNIRRTQDKWLGLKKEQDDPAFFQFEFMEYGIRAALAIIRTHVKRDRSATIASEVSRWAPTSENNTEAYITFVTKRMGLAPEHQITLDRSFLLSFVKSIAAYECANYPIPDACYNRAWQHYVSSV